MPCKTAQATICSPKSCTRQALGRRQDVSGTTKPWTRELDVMASLENMPGGIQSSQRLGHVSISLGKDCASCWGPSGNSVSQRCNATGLVLGAFVRLAGQHQVSVVDVSKGDIREYGNRRVKTLSVVTYETSIHLSFTCMYLQAVLGWCH